MDPISSDPVAEVIALKSAGLKNAVGVAVLAKSLENERLIAAELARILQVGTALDVTA